jgi:hypothetical protein
MHMISTVLSLYRKFVLRDDATTIAASLSLMVSFRKTYNYFRLIEFNGEF